MSSQIAVVNALVESCKGGDTYSGLQTLKAVLQRKVRAQDEAAAHAIIVEAFRLAALPYKSAEVATELSAELIRILTAFGHNGDVFGLEKARVIHEIFMDVLESDASADWCRSHVNFIVSALDWCVGAEGAEESADATLFLNEALCRANIRLAHCIAADEEEAVCRAVVDAYWASLRCAPMVDLIEFAAREVRPRLTAAERPFLIARTIHGLLSCVGGGAAAAPRVRAIDAARSLLASDATSQGEDPALRSFLNDVLLILAASVTQRTRPPEESNGAAGCRCGKVIEALSDAYKSALVSVSDLNWVDLSRFF